MALQTRIKELRSERKALVEKGRAILDKADAEKRAATGEENEQWQRVMDDVDKLGQRIDQLERQLGAEDDVGDGTDDDKKERKDACREEDPGDEDEDKDDKKKRKEDDDDDDERSQDRIVLPDGRVAVLLKAGSNRRSQPGSARQPERRSYESPTEYRDRCRRSTPEYRAAWEAYLIGGPQALRGVHSRAMQADIDLVGGYMVAPQEFVADLIKFVDNQVFVRQLATKYVVATAQSLGAPSLDTDIADSDWTSELATGSEDSSLAFGKRELHPHPLAKRIKVSNKLMRMARISSVVSSTPSKLGTGEAIVRDRLGYKFGTTQEAAFMTGNGVNKPLGVFTASSRGISTARDVATGSTTNYTADGLIQAKYTLKPQYWKDARWMFHRDGVRRIRQLKDGMGQYLWQPGLTAGAPDTLLDNPMDVSEYCPNTFTTGQYVGLLGVWKYYWIVDAETLQIQRLMELYAESNQVGFIARQELDGMPVLEEAWVRVVTS